MFGFNLHGDMGETCEITVKLGNTIVQKVTIPFVFAKAQFMSIAAQIAQDEKPMQVKCTVKEYTEKGRELNCSLSFDNAAYAKAFKEGE